MSQFAGRKLEEISVTEIMSHMETCFTNLLKRSGRTIPGLDSKVWTEGGSFLPPPEIVKPPPLTSKEMIEARLYCDSVEDAVTKIKRKIDNDALPIVSLPCGMGKSTTLMNKLARARIADNIICVQPSFTVAMQLADYQIMQGANAKFGLFKLPMTVSYIAASELVNAVAGGDDFSNSLVVIDEEQMSTPVHHAINVDVIPRLRGPVLKMTASFNQHLNKRVGVTKTETDTVDAKTIAKCQIGTEIIVVGIDDDMNRHMPGALATGLNLKVTSVIDTGRRIDPSYENGSLTITERVASSLELTQSIGRLNRRASDGPGRFIYNSSPRVNSCKSNKVNYYALIYTALHTMFCRPDVKDQYGPILSGQSTRWIVPLNPGPRSNDHRSFRSYNSGKSNASQREPVIKTEITPIPVIKPNISSVSKSVTTASLFSTSKSHWWSQTPPAVESSSTGQKAEILYEEIMNMLTEFNGLERSFNISSSQVQEANRALNGQQVPLYTNDEIGAMIVIARRYIETRVGKHNNELLNNLRDYFLSAMMCRKMEL